jgi:DNA-binding NarL/FixJ family response regulator
MTMITIVLIDDNRLVREGLAGLIRGQKDFKILAASADVEEALRKVRDARPRVVLLDLALEDEDSLLITRTVRQEVPEARVIVMGMLPLQEDIAAFVRAGASGFLMKDASVDEFIQSIRAVAAGHTVLPTQLTASLFGEITRTAVARGRGTASATVRLTERERQVIDLIGEGLSNKEIARRLNIAIHTVKSHVHNLLEKLALHTRLEVAAFTRGESEAEPPVA